MPKYRPHGSTETTFEAGQLTRRIITRKKDKKNSVSVSRRALIEFSQSSPDYLLACYISAIDKILKKPLGKSKPTRAQYDLRCKLGAEIWPELKRVGGIARDVFERRLHPYLSEQDFGQLRKDSAAFPFATDDAIPKGRWYYSFFGKTSPKEADMSGIGEAITAHLLKNGRLPGQHCKRPSSQKSGQVIGRASTATKSVPGPGSNTAPSWGDVEWDIYTAAGDLPGQILVKAETKERDGNQFGFRDASEHIYEHYGRVFTRPGDSAPTKVRDLNPDERRVLALHDEIRSLYRSRLSGEKSARAAKVKVATAARHLPVSWSCLRTSLSQRRNNSDLMALVRTGKVIHYTLEENTADADAVQIAGIETSDFWTSAGQQEIKRAEAFIRIWINVLGFIGHSFADWTDPGRAATKDILTRDGWKDVHPRFADPDIQQAFEAKTRNLFGRRAPKVVELAQPEKLTLVEHLRSAISDLRNGSFHFKGLSTLVAALEELSEDDAGFCQDLWDADVAARFKRLSETLKGVAIFNFMVETDANKLMRAIAASPGREVSLPRMNRLLDRYEKAWKGRPHPSVHITRALPNAPKRRQMETDDARRCQYVCLKLLYERAFPDWLLDQPVALLNDWIAEAEGHATDSARKITKDSSTTSQVEKRAYRLAADEDLWALFDRLGHDIATANAPQRGYAPDEDKARANSERLENFKRDVILLAFARFLDDRGFGFLAELTERAGPKVPVFGTTIGKKMTVASAAPWQSVLYTLLHLAPVGQVSALNQQLIKWRTLHGKRAARAAQTVPVPGFADAAPVDAFGAKKDGVEDPVGKLAEVFGLFLEMHDAKFIREQGEPGLASSQDIASLFEKPWIAEKMFPDDPKADAEGKLPIRGLREMIRFGGMEALQSIFENAPITEAESMRFDRLEKDVVGAQKEREDLHDAWVNDKNGFSLDEILRYKTALGTVSEHRLLAGRMRLTDHVQAYRVVMQILGRLQTMTAIWERDLYFVLLALCRRAGHAPKEVLNAEGKRLLARGQIVWALNKFRGDGDHALAAKIQDISNDLRSIFNVTEWHAGDRIVRTRNKLAHYHAVRAPEDGTEAEPLDLTALMNDVRAMMAYDRKQKNSVVRVIKELLEREKLDVTWTMEQHDLETVSVAGREAQHLGGSGINEPLVSDAFVSWVAQALGAPSAPRAGSVVA